MRYFICSNNPDQVAQWETTLEAAGFEVADTYDPDAIIVTLGGDGSILHAAREYAAPTILPVRSGDSKGFRTTVEPPALVETLDRLESAPADDAYTVHSFPKIAAFRGESQLSGGFDALNEVSLHHAAPTLGVEFALRIDDGATSQSFERVIGDGALVATPFGSTAYYRAITGGTFSHGLGVAFNNIHSPRSAPTSMVVSPAAVVEVELLDTDHASPAVLTRDNADETYEMRAGDVVTIRQIEAGVELIEPGAGEE